MISFETWNAKLMTNETKLPTHNSVMSGDDVTAPTASAKTLVNIEMRIAGPVS
jgi:hypothetical protein